MPPVLLTPIRPGLRLASLLVAGLAGRARRWPTESQQGARRNAMVACTAAASRRAERDEVEDYLTALATERREAAAHG